MHLQIDVARQRLTLFRSAKPLFSCTVSTAFAGTGTVPGSLRTPTGRFVISEKIGKHAPIGSVFRSRISTGEVADPQSPSDQVTSRILWLAGCDEANANTKSRYIYLHGTNHEAQLGLPVSHGCIRLSNNAIADLFELVDVETPVIIR